MLAPYAGEATWRGACKALSTSARTRPSSCLTFSSSRVQNPISFHQRKFSSSKASNASKEESRSITTNTTKASAATAPSKPAFHSQSPNSDLVAPPRGRRRKSKDQNTTEKQNQAGQLSLPSVPSTQRLHPLDVHLASFFSQHRPISITHNIPPTISQDEFISLFSSSLNLDPKAKTEDVIHTLSAAVTHLDDTLAQHGASAAITGTASEEAEMRAQLSESITSTADAEVVSNTDGPAPLDANDLIKTLRPFVPPPPPEPQTPSPTARQKARIAPQEPIHTTYTSTVTVYETLHPSGQRTFRTVATPVTTSTPTPSSPSPSSPTLTTYNLPSVSDPSSSYSSSTSTTTSIESPQPYPYMERVKDYRRSIAGIMQLISVRRQRKLKMKKHKHRKLLKRTRNLRRKLDKT